MHEKGYDFSDIGKLIEKYGYIAHIKSCRDENTRKEISGFRARR
jgi:hypothetical protein